MEYNNLMIWLTTVLLFLIGAAWGSFLFVLAWRLPRGEDFIKSRSKCAKCSQQLQLWETIPLLSYIVLRAKCRTCKKFISWHYFAVEFLVGSLIAFGYWQLGLTYEFLLFVIEISVLVLIFIIDFYTGWVYEIIVVPAIVLVFAMQLIFGHEPMTYLLGLLIGGGVFWLQHVVSKGKWIGKGDIRIGAFMGAILGWKLLIVALIMGYFLGAAISLILIMTGIKKRTDMIPFGPFLVVGTIATLIWGQAILDWYLNLIGF